MCVCVCVTQPIVLKVSTKGKCACVGLRPRGEDTKLQASVYDTLGGRVPESEAEATINQCSEHSE